MTELFSSNLLERCGITRVMAGQVAGTDDTIDGTGVDLTEYEGCESIVFAALFGTITATAVTTLHLEGSNDDTTYVDLEDSEVTVLDTDDDSVKVVECRQLTNYRYVRGVITRATANAVIDGMLAIRGGFGRVPISLHASDVVVTDPDTGTP